MAELKIKADSGCGTVSLKGPATTTSNAAVQLTLPVDDGTANQYLKTDGSGALSWATVDTSIADDSITEAKLDIHAAPSGTDKYLGYTSNGMEWKVPSGLGKVVQWKHSTKTDVSSRTHSTFIDIPGTDETGSGSIFECNITTTGTNKVLVIPSIMVASSNMGWLKLIRNTGGTDTDLGKGDAASSKRDIYWGAYAGGSSNGSMYYGVMPITAHVLDSPGAGTHSYRCQFASDGTSYVMYVNRCIYDLDPYHPRTQSAITLLELAV